MAETALRLFWSLAVAGLLASGASQAGKLPAFPGAEGFGAASIGGRGGRVIKVTNLKASGLGSLQWAAAQPGARIVVFDVGGVIRGDVEIRHPRITIAGQTAPSPGITIVGRLLARPVEQERLHDVIVRFLRVRPEPTTGHGGDAIQLPGTDRLILDHVSASWGNDEIVDLIHSADVTVQWSTIEESSVTGHAKGVPHNFGLISTYPGSGNISIHHNLFAHHSRRAPSLAPYERGHPGDFRNNVIYNVQQALTHDGHIPKAGVNLVGNYYKRGPDVGRMAPFGFHPRGRYYVARNVLDGYGRIDSVGGWSGRLPQWLLLPTVGDRVNTPFPVAAVTTDTGVGAFRKVVARAGCWPRDRVTRRTLEEVLYGLGGWGRDAPTQPGDEWLTKGLSSGSAPRDSDADGMPDAWEVDRSRLDRDDAGDHRLLMESGYTAIETYLHQRAAEIIRPKSAAANAHRPGRNQ